MDNEPNPILLYRHSLKTIQRIRENQVDFIFYFIVFHFIVYFFTFFSQFAESNINT